MSALDGAQYQWLCWDHTQQTPGPRAAALPQDVGAAMSTELGRGARGVITSGFL